MSKENKKSEKSKGIVTEKPKAPRAQRVRGKKYASVRSKVDHNRSYTISDALKLVKETSFSKFDGTVELHAQIKKGSLSVNITLPHQFGNVKVVEFADDKTIEKLKTGKIDFDVLVATADIMPKLVAFARILGPKGMMPNPKNGTLVKDKKAAEKFSGNAMTIKTEKDRPLIHTKIGKVSMSDQELMENYTAVVTAIGSKQLVRTFVKASMGPSVKIEIE